MKKIPSPRLKTLVAATMLGLAMNANATTIQVTSSADLGAGTLRNALAVIQADSVCTGAPYVVTFAIASPATGEIVIPVGSGTTGQPLPAVACNTTIDGYTQSGSVQPASTAQPLGPSGAVIRIFLDGSVVSVAPQVGIRLGGAGSIVQGLAIGNFTDAGITIDGTGSAYGNFVGLRADGMSSAPNNRGIGGFGINANVGGPLLYQRNVIGPNAGSGIDAYYNWIVKNNLIGTAADGTSPRGNAIGVLPSIEGVTIGGLATGEGNRIAFNGKGIATNNFANSGYFFSGNEIYSNSAIGIDLGNNGVTPNDPTDTDNRQNFPVINDVTYSGGLTNINFTLNTSSGATPLSLEFFGNVDGAGQGKFPINGCNTSGQTANAAGVLGPLVLGCTGTWSNITATAAKNAFMGGTSEFSAPFLTPQLTPSPSALTFPTTAVGGLSSPVILNINNGGTAGSSLTIDAIANSGPAEFYDTTGGAPPQPAGPGKPYCGLGSDAAGAPLAGTPQPGPCTLNLAFRPQASGSRTAALTFTDANSPTSSISVSLTGVGGTVTPPTTSVSFSPVSLNLPGPTPALSTMSIAIANIGNGATFSPAVYTKALPANVVIANPVTPPSVRFVGAGCAGVLAGGGLPGNTGFGVSGLTVPAGGSCTIEVDVTSSIAGSYPVTVANGDITGLVASQSVATVATVPTATLTVNPPAVPAVQLTPPSLAFGNVTVLTSSPTQTVTLTNTGNAPLSLGTFSFSPAPNDFVFLTACPTLLPAAPGPGNSCTIDFTFNPSLAVARTTSLLIPSNAATSPDSIPMSGTGVAVPVPVVSLSASAVTFPSQTVGSTSSPQIVTLTNSGAAPLLISSVVAAPADFAVANGCPSTLPAAPGPGNSCQLTITFSPLVAGTRVGDVKVFDNASGSPHTVTLSGTGAAPPVPTPVAPGTVSFPATQVGTGFGPVSITLGNSGAGLLTVSSVLIVGGGYTIASDACSGGSIALGGSCTVTVNFAPTVVGSISAQLRFLTNAPVSTVVVVLSGSGTASPIGTLSATPGSLLFGSLVVGTSSAAQGVTVTNAGSATVVVSGVSITGDFAQTNNCGTLIGGASCTVNVTFTPTVIGGSSGTVTITSNATNPQLAVGLSGTGSRTPEAVIELSASSLAYGNRFVGAAGAGQFITMKNVGGGTLVISRLYAVGDFVLNHNCPVAMTTDASCRLDITFTASVPGPRGGKIVIESNALGGTKEIPLTGSGCRISSGVRNRNTTLLCQ